MRFYLRNTLIATATLVVALTFGCDNLSLGAVTGADVTPERNAFSEHEFAADPTLAARLNHYVAVNLEPTGTHEGDTGADEGVDEIPYQIDKPTSVAVGVPAKENHGHWIEFCNEKGEPLAFAKGNQATSVVTLQPGRYKVRVHHSGRAGQPMQTVFLRAGSIKPATSAAQRREYRPEYYGYDDSIFCDDNGANGFLNVDDHGEDDAFVLITGDLSCADINGWSFSGGYGGVILDFTQNARNMQFTNCNFDRSAIAGTLTNARFINCTLTNVDWDHVKLAGASVLQNCNLQTRVDLHLLDMSGITITNCNFSNSKLNGAQFQGATIRGCNFNGANFGGANISGQTAMFQPASGNQINNAAFAGVIAQNIDFTVRPLTSLATDWSRADLTGCTLNGQTLTTCNFTSTIFAGAQMKNVVCTNNATLAGTNMTSANLENADFSGGNFTHATLDKANVVAANFANCTLDNASGHGASFAFSNFSNATFAAAQLGGAAGSNSQAATFTYAYMPNVRITDQADFRNVDFSHSHMYGPNSNVQTAELTGANFSAAVISGMDFSGATLESCSFEDAQAVGTKFVSARLNDAKFVGAYLMGADFTNAVVTNAVFVDAAISTAPCSNAANCSKCSTDACKFKDLNPAALCCYSFSEPDGTVYAVNFGATVLPSDTSMVCPNGELGPCTGAKLTPRADGPYPPVPACVPSLLNWCPAPTQSE